MFLQLSVNDIHCLGLPRALANNGVSTILAMGGSGDYFDVADCVICMDAYRPRDLTQEAKSIVEKHGPSAAVKNLSGRAYPNVVQRCLTPISFYKGESSIHGCWLGVSKKEMVPLDATHEDIDIEIECCEV